MKIITGYTGEPHLTSTQDRAAHQGIVGEGSYILNVGRKLAAEVVSANEVRIRDGVLSHQGCFGIIESATYDTLTIANGSQGMLRHDLIVCRYTKDASTNVESLAFVVIQGAAASSNPADPAYNTGNIASGDSPVDMPLYRVNIDGITIDSVDVLCKTSPSAADSDDLHDILRSRGFLHADAYSIPGTGYQVVLEADIPANNTGHDITYKVGGYATVDYVSAAANASVMLSVWWDNVHHGRDVQTLDQVATYGLDSFGCVTIPAGGSAKHVVLFISHSLGTGTLSDCGLWYEPVAWT